MNTFVLRYLNGKAKDWPYYRNDRTLQRRYIKEALKDLRHVVECKRSYVIIGKTGECRVHYTHEGYGACSRSGMTMEDFWFYANLGVPGIDTRGADYGKLCDVVIKGPIIAVCERDLRDQVFLNKTAFGYVPFSVAAPAYIAAGCQVYNAERAL